MKHYLFSAVNRCPPCRQLVFELNSKVPNWKEHVEYINADDMTPEQHELAGKLQLKQLPAFCTNENILFTGVSPQKIQIVKIVCTQA